MGILARGGTRYFAKAVVLTTGTFLKALMPFASGLAQHGIAEGRDAARIEPKQHQAARLRQAGGQIGCFFGAVAAHDAQPQIRRNLIRIFA